MIYLRGIALNVFPDGNSYLSDLPVVRYLHTAKHLEFRKPVTFFVGENGTGKSTLLDPETFRFPRNAHILTSINS